MTASTFGERLQLRERWSWILLGAGLLLAVLTGVVIYSLTGEARPAAPQSVATESLVVARVDIPAFTTVTADMIELRNRTPDAIPAATIRDLAQAVGRTTLDLIPAGTALTSKEVAGADQGGASASLQRSKVLMVFAPGDALSEARVLRRGDRIDIQATIPGVDGAFATQSIVQNLEVFAIGSGQPVLLTFVVDPQTSLVLKYLRDSGARIDLVVRSSADTQRLNTSTVDLLYLRQTFGIMPTK